MHDLLQGKWQSLCEAADAYSELSEYARKEKQWLLQRVSASLSLHRPEPCAASNHPLSALQLYSVCAEGICSSALEGPSTCFHGYNFPTRIHL